MTSSELRAAAFEGCRAELITYATRLIVRPDIAEEIAQEAAVRLLKTDTAFDADADVRHWLFRVVSNLAIDHLRRHSTWKEMVLVDARGRAEATPEFMAASLRLRDSPETSAIAREHLAVCFACTLRNLPPHEASALLLKEVHGFATAEIAEMLGASAVQVKNWLQQARRTLEQRYAHTCALVAKQGICHQCVELDGFFNNRRRDPLDGTSRTVEARLAILRDLRARSLGPWHRRMMSLIDDLLPGG
jgi:RNA polymerase sigma-70 factor (ECF subfamily)